VTALGGFLAFRFFDIVKPFPVRNAERLRGGIGIMADDLIAAVYAAVAVRLFVWILASLVAT
jgi:phosphatidylglycerophosphatase A